MTDPRDHDADLGDHDPPIRLITMDRNPHTDELIIREFQRFEGVSDPDDMAIVYAIESMDGTRGSLVDAFGTYSSPTVSAFLHDVPIRRTVGPGSG